jgi:hypothetical protein
MTYTKLIERLYNSHDAETLCADAAGVIEALTVERDALQAESERLKGLLSEVSGNFTRDDDLPDGLLGRIDTAIKQPERL